MLGRAGVSDRGVVSPLLCMQAEIHGRGLYSVPSLSALPEHDVLVVESTGLHSPEVFRSPWDGVAFGVG